MLEIDYKQTTASLALSTPSVHRHSESQVHKLHVKQIFVQPRPSAVNMTLPAFAAECRAEGGMPTARRAPLMLSAGACYQSISPSRGALSSKPAGRRCCCRSMRQTDGRSTVS